MILNEKIKVKELLGLPANVYCVLAKKHVNLMSDLELMHHYQKRQQKTFVIPKGVLFKMYGDYLVSNIFKYNEHSVFTIYKGE